MDEVKRFETDDWIKKKKAQLNATQLILINSFQIYLKDKNNRPTWSQWILICAESKNRAT